MVGSKVLKIYKKKLNRKYKQAKNIPYWDGKTTERIADILQCYY